MGQKRRFVTFYHIPFSDSQKNLIKTSSHFHNTRTRLSLLQCEKSQNYRRYLIFSDVSSTSKFPEKREEKEEREDDVVVDKWGIPNMNIFGSHPIG